MVDAEASVTWVFSGVLDDFYKFQRNTLIRKGGEATNMKAG